MYTFIYISVIILKLQHSICFQKKMGSHPLIGYNHRTFYQCFVLKLSYIVYILKKKIIHEGT